MSLNITTEQVTDVPDTPAVTMRDLVTRWQKGDLSAARPLIDMLGSTLHVVIGQRNQLELELARANTRADELEEKLARSESDD